MIYKNHLFIHLCSLFFIFFHYGEAQPIKKPILTEHNSSVTIKIGQRKTLSEGNAASLRTIVRLFKKYPKANFYNVIWSVKLANKPLNVVYTRYIRSEDSVTRHAQSVNSKLESINALQYDGVSKDELRRVIHHGGSFRELEKIAADYSQHQQYWR